MKRLTTSLLLLVSLATSASIDYQDPVQNEPHFKIQPNHYLDFPVTKKDFTHWETMGAAVILKNRLVLTPQTRDKKGVLYSTLPNELIKDWMLEVEVHIGNENPSTVRGGTGMGIYYLRNVDQVSHKESIFGYTNRFDGLGIYLNTVLKREKQAGAHADREYLNAIQGFYNDGSRPINVFSEKKHLCYKAFRNLPQGQNLKLRLQYDYPLVTLQVYDIYSQAFEFCLSFEAPQLDFNGYFLISGASGVHNPDHIYIKSVKVYDPKTIASNEHFQEVRRTKLNQLQDKVQEGVKDLFDHHSQEDMGFKDAINNPGKTRRSNRSSNESEDLAALEKMIPTQHNHLTHRLKQMVSTHESNTDKFFDIMRGLPTFATYQELVQKLFTFRLTIDKLSSQIDRDSTLLRTFDKKVRQVRYTSNIQKGLEQREVNNPQTKQLQADINDIEDNMQILAGLIRDYQAVVENLGAKIKKEAGFTQKLEQERKTFAKEQSQDLKYDMSEIDSVFTDMEIKVTSAAGGWSALMVNIGMIAVVMFSGFLWLKMSRYETKNS